MGRMCSLIGAPRTSPEPTLESLAVQLNTLTGLVSQMNGRMDDMNGQINEIKSLLLASVGGHPEIIDSSVMIFAGNNRIGCGIIARSQRYGVIIVTARHVVTSKVALSVFGKSEINVKDWQVAKDLDIDLAFAPVIESDGLKAVNITSDQIFLPGMQIWAYPLIDGEVVALTGRIVKTYAKRHLVTDVGGIPGFSGTGYIDIFGRLQMIHTGSSSEVEGISSENWRGSSDENAFHNAERNCQAAMNISMFGDSNHIYTCLRVFELSALNKHDDPTFDVLRQSCEGTLSLYVPDISPCVAVFIQQSVGDREQGEAALLRSCYERWKPAYSCSKFWKSVMNRQDTAETKEACRKNWFNLLHALLKDCAAFVRYAARNPRARGVPASLIESQDITFEPLNFWNFRKVFHRRFPQVAARG